MNDGLDVALDDRDLLAEITLVTDLMVAAGESVGALKQATIDRLLGLAEGRAHAEAS